MVEERPAGSLDSARFASEVRDRLQACRSSRSPKDLLEHCEKLFRLLRDKKLELRVPFIPSSCSPPNSRGDGKDGFVNWLGQSFETFVSLVFELLSSSDPHMQKLGLSYLFRITKNEAQIHQSAAFPLSAFQVLIARLLQSEGFSNQMLDSLVADYSDKFIDIRYYLLVVVGKILREFAQRKAGEARTLAVEQDLGEDLNDTEDQATHMNKAEAQSPGWYVWIRGEHELSKRFTALLLRMSSSFSNVKVGASRGKRKRVPRPQPESESNSDSAGQDSSDSESGAKTYIPGLGNSKALQIANHRLVYQNSWLTLLLDVEHDKVTIQKLLSSVPKSVMPLMSNPLLLADFFLKAFRDANHLSISMSALSGMFYLLSKHRLGNPDVIAHTDGLDASSKEAQAAGAHFYQRLYRLVTPASFSPRLRVRFLRLLNMALRSDLLPTHLVASFIKKCIRVACVVSPAATLCLEALVLSTLQKYYATCKPLLSLPEHYAARLRVAGDGFDYCTTKIREGKEDSISSEDEEPNDAEEENAIFDLVSNSIPKRLEVNKTDICALTRKEARMSLWEVDLLSKHSLKSLQQMSELFDTDIGNPASKRVCVDDFLDVTTGSLLSRELKALEKSSSAPLPAFEAPSVPPDVPHLYKTCLMLTRQ